MARRITHQSNDHDDALPTQAQVERFEMLAPMLKSLHDEMRELSKKKPDGILNSLKIMMINRVLAQIKDVVGAESTNEYLDMLDEANMPQNSDAVLILGQYQAAMGLFRDKHYGRVVGGSYDQRWITRENPGTKLER